MLFNNNAETPITNTTTLPLIETPIQIVEETTPKPFVNPPLKGINVPFSSYKIQGNKAKTIQHSSGSLIKIPTNAFINKNGDVIKGNVEIKYREFKDIAEIFASGIPMNYNDKGTEFHFESAGMIEILAYQDGQPILINPKKKIDIEMTSDYAGTQYNLYSLDTTNREWVYEGKDKVIMKGGSEPKEVAVIENLLDEFTISDNVATTPEGNPELKSIKEEIVVIQKDIKKIKKTEPIQPAKASENRFIFDLDVDKNEFPEMVVYEGMEFEIGDENKNFSPTLTNKEWEDISLAKNKQGKYILTLSRSVNKRKGKERNFETDTETKKFIVYPVYEGKN